ncbi:MAG: cysteine protease [Aromatoleum sp.]|jgi:hypothetical protein|uniref:cysteine protease n=1 Tax=Aromatoleum sp. TaxID=2307007 RepID=UPI00289577FF|nr:cysteine protease [Aromatoleum sp.]MDT3671272.1 cysteine protease [Aromatoleum sp.]
MIFNNPKGAPELACDECGCRWVDRISGTCYECGAPVSAEAQAEFVRALAAFADDRRRTVPDLLS